MPRSKGPLVYHVFLAGGEYLGPARSLTVAEAALRQVAGLLARPGEPVGCIWTQRGEGPRHLLKTVYKEPGEARGGQ